VLALRAVAARAGTTTTLDAASASKPNAIRRFDFGGLLAKETAECEEYGLPVTRDADVEYADLDGDGAEEAIVTASSCLTGTAGPDIVRVYRLAPDGGVVEMPVSQDPRFEGRRYDEGLCWKSGSRLTARGGRLVREYSDASGLEHPLTVFYGWSGKEFRVASVQKDPHIQARLDRSAAARRRMHAVSPDRAAALISAFPVPTPGSNPRDIAVGPDGALWFTETSARKIGRIDPHNPGEVTEVPLPIANRQPWDITRDADGNLWFTENYAGWVGRMLVASKSVEEFSVPGKDGGPPAIVAAPGGSLWVTGRALLRFASAHPETISELPIPDAGPGMAARSITIDRQGTVWFVRGSEYGGSRIGRVQQDEPARIVEYPLPGVPYDVTLGPDGNLWVVGTSLTVHCSEDIGRVWRVTPGDPPQIQELPLADSQPIAITSGPDGNLWFTVGRDKVARVVPREPFCVTEFTVPPPPGYRANASPRGITTGPDGHLWFTEVNGNQVARLKPPDDPEIEKDCAATPP